MAHISMRELVLLGLLQLIHPVIALEQLKLMLILPWSGPDPVGPYIGAAFPVALKYVYSRPEFSNLTKLYNVTWDAYDVTNPREDVVKLMISTIMAEELKARKMPIFLFGQAPSRVCEYIALVAAAFDVQFISAMCIDTRLDDAELYSTFSRTVASGGYWAAVLVKTVERFDWKVVAVVTSDDENLVGILDELHKGLTAINVHVVTFSVSEEDVESLRVYVDSSRVFILLVQNITTVVNFLVLATELNVLDVKDYTFLLIHFRYDGSYVSKFSSVMARLNGILILNVEGERNELAWQNFRFQVSKASKDPHFVGLKKATSFSLVVRWASYLYDAVILWATALNKALSFPPNSEFYSLSGAKLNNLTKNIEFQGISRTRTTDSRGHVNDNFTLSVVQVKGLFKRLVQIGNFLVKDDNILADFQFLNRNGVIVWAGNSTELPTGEPPCGWGDPNCVWRNQLLMVAVLASAFLVSLLVITFGMIFLFRFLRARYLNSDISSWIVDWYNILLLPEKPYVPFALRNPRLSVGSSGWKFSKDKTDLLGFSMRKSIESSDSSLPSFYQHLFTVVGMLDNTKVAIKRVPFNNIRSDDKNLIHDVEEMRNLRHENLNEFVGICLHPENSCILMTYAKKGSLMDVLRNDAIKLSWDFKFALACDISKGMVYLHRSRLGSHGHLTSSNCLVDSRWVCKVTDYGMGHFREPPIQKTYNQDDSNALLWTAPELLRQTSTDRPMYGTKPGDIYSFGIIMQEITLREEPFRGKISLSPEDILDRVRILETPPFRPLVLESQCKKSWWELMHRCWNEEPASRPPFSVILPELETISGNKVVNVVDNMMKMLEKHAENLEDLIKERQMQLDNETKRVESILNNIFPKSVVKQLMTSNRVTPETFEMVTLYFSDISDFSSMCTRSTPMQIIDLLNAVYSLFDKVTDTYDVYKVETINDNYLVASGLPIRNVIHATEIANMALHLMNSSRMFKIPHLPNDKLLLRIGIHSGTVVAGVVGLQQPRYCIFGDTVNTASRMQSNGLPLKIHISSSTAVLLKKNSNFKVVKRGEMTVKGKGQMTTYWLTKGKTFSFRISRIARSKDTE